MVKVHEMAVVFVVKCVIMQGEKRLPSVLKKKEAARQKVKTHATNGGNLKSATLYKFS